MKYFSIFILLLFVSCSSSVEPKDNKVKLPYNSVHFTCGVPLDKDSSDDYIIIRPQYCLSYNKNNNIPNWVAWELNKEWYGDVPRYEGNFITDVSLPDGFYRVKHDDYTNTGYDRGHLVRSEERTKTVEDNKSTFILTNIIAQTPDLNRGVWLDLEYYCEKLCKDENKELFIYAGGTGSNAKKLESGVSVPDSCFKIVLVLNKGQGLKDITDKTEVIAVLMPNIDGIRSEKWGKYITSVDAIELNTGYDFLNLIPDNIENVLEKKITIVSLIKSSIPSIQEKSSSNESNSVQCKGITQKGSRCLRTTTDQSGYCWQHVNQGNVKKSEPSEYETKTVQCRGTTKKGSRCSRMTTDPSGYCWQHK